MALDYEVILHQIGGFGRHQLFLYVWFLLSLVVIAGTMGFMAFAGAGPNVDKSVASNLTSEKNLTLNFSFYSIAAEWGLVDGYAYIVATITVHSRGYCWVSLNTSCCPMTNYLDYWFLCAFEHKGELNS